MQQKTMLLTNQCQEYLQRAKMILQTVSDALETARFDAKSRLVMVKRLLEYHAINNGLCLSVRRLLWLIRFLPSAGFI